MSFQDLVTKAFGNISVLTFVAALSIIFVLRSIYRVFLHPISHIPGPLIPKLTSLWLHYHTYIGNEATTLHTLHKNHGPIVRISPNDISISDADSIHPIYISKGGFPKAPCYANFDIDGHKTIFSTTESEYRSPRAKAVMPLFSTKCIRESTPALYACVDRFVQRVRREASTKMPVNMINVARSLAIDSVSTHLFQENYNGTSEKGPKLSVSGFVDACVAVGRFFYLPNFVFVWLEWGIEKMHNDQSTGDSTEAVDKFVENLVHMTKPDSTNFPGKLMATGLSDSEVKAQCKDLIFAGTDSTGMNLSTLLRRLVLHPEKYQRLREEVTANASLGSNAVDVQALPYLSAVIREGLRVSMANPVRLPHVVPSPGWNFKGTHFPADSIVGCSAYELHFNPELFPEPFTFNPERWLDESADTDLMNNYWFAFGAGSRACIARNLATMVLYFAVEQVALRDVLNGAKVVKHGDVEIFEWFNSKVKGGKIELVWE